MYLMAMVSRALSVSFLWTVLLLCLLWRASCSFYPQTRVFQLYVDRLYYVDMLREVARLCGQDKQALSIGFENGINNDDLRIMETMPPDNWYVVEKSAQQFGKYNLKSEVAFHSLGHVVIGMMENMTTSPLYQHRFHVIVDYGVLGFMTAKRSVESITNHVASFPKLMAPGGVLFIKHDMARKDMRYPWVLIRRELEKFFNPLFRFIQLTPGCKDHTLEKKILELDGGDDAGYLKGTHINGSMLPLTTHQRYRSMCDAYLHTQWVLK